MPVSCWNAAMAMPMKTRPRHLEERICPIESLAPPVAVRESAMAATRAEGSASPLTASSTASASFVRPTETR